MTLLNIIKISNKAMLFTLTVLPCLLFASTGFAQTPPVLVFTPVISSGLISPLDIVNAGDGSGRLFIVQRGGTVKIAAGGTLLPGNFLDIPDSITSGGERGLLSIVFHPDFINNRYFFVYYTNTAGDVTITRFQTQAGNPNAADESTGVVLMTIPQPFTNHNGGKLNFGPDGNLFFGTGDGGSGGDPNNNAQNGNSLLGKMIRINVDDFTTPPYYSIPPDNPYVADPNVRDEIFAMGLRNPWRWSFDRLNNDVWIADVGQGAFEEINAIPLASAGGINYGWRCYEGNAPYNTSGCLPQSSYTSPIFDYPHNSATGGFSVTGGYVYRGSEFAAMYGYYICADYVSGNAWVINSDGSGGWNATLQSGLPGSVAGFGEAENGDLFAIALNGVLYKVNTSTVLPVTLKLFAAEAFDNYNEIQWKTVNEQNLSHFEIEYSYDGVNFTNTGTVNAVNLPLENNYRFQHFISSYNKIFYRIKIVDSDGHLSYSAIIKVDGSVKTTIKVYPSPVTENNLTIVSKKQVEQIILFTAEGKNIFQMRLNNTAGTINIPLPRLQNGMYFLQLKLKDEFVNQKVLIQQK